MSLPSSDRKSVTQYQRADCFFCGSDGPIETHHILPRRHGGTDVKSNLVDLCPTCHERVEQLYSDQIWTTYAQNTVFGSGDMTNAVEPDGKPNRAEEVWTILSQELLTPTDTITIAELVVTCNTVSDINPGTVRKSIAYYEFHDAVEFTDDGVKMHPDQC